MRRLTPYRSPRNARRFRVLVDEPRRRRGRVLVCEGLPRPRRGAYWRLVVELDVELEEAAAAARVLVRRELGFALVPADCAELDLVSAAGELVA